MISNLLPLAALLFGSALLLFAGGINSLILPIRGEMEGFSAVSLGLLGTGWAVGYVAGCLRTPSIVMRVGHIRAFGAMCAIAAFVVLLSLLLIEPWAWIPLRALSGFCFAGASMIVESWLNEQTDAPSRGKVFGVYTMVNLGATTCGQMILATGDASGFFFFVLAAMVYCLALLPTALSATNTPRPLTQVSLDLKSLWQNSPAAVFSVLMVGISNGTFGTLAAVYSSRIGFDQSRIALFASIPILAGAAMQLPVGYLSDRFDRRLVLVGITVLAMVADTTFFLSNSSEPRFVLPLVAVLGAALYSMYPIIVAHAIDHAEPGNYIQVSGGLLMIFGIGSIAGPLIGGLSMSQFGESSLFLVTGSAHLLIFAFVLWRMRKRAPVINQEKDHFNAQPLPRLSTPETAALSSAEPD